MPIRRNKRWRETKVLLRGNVEKAVASSAILVQRDLKLKLSQPGTGRFYARGKRANTTIMPFGEMTEGDVAHLVAANKSKAKTLRALGVHRASAPGEPPAVDFGHLRRSIQADVSRLKESNPRARVGTNMKYGPALEYGNPLHRLAPRPYFRPVARAARPKILALFHAKQLLAVGMGAGLKKT